MSKFKLKKIGGPNEKSQGKVEVRADHERCMNRRGGEQGGDAVQCRVRVLLCDWVESVHSFSGPGD